MMRVLVDISAGKVLQVVSSSGLPFELEEGQKEIVVQNPGLINEFMNGATIVYHSETDSLSSIQRTDPIKQQFDQKDIEINLLKQQLSNTKAELQGFLDFYFSQP